MRVADRAAACQCNFESYRDLVGLIRRRLPEERALAAVEKREMEYRARKEYERIHGPDAAKQVPSRLKP